MIISFLFGLFFHLYVVSLTVSGIISEWKISHWATSWNSSAKSAVSMAISSIILPSKVLMAPQHLPERRLTHQIFTNRIDFLSIFCVRSTRKSQLWSFKGEEKVIYNPTRAHGDIYKLETSRPTKVKFCQSFPFFWLVRCEICKCFASSTGFAPLSFPAHRPSTGLSWLIARDTPDFSRRHGLVSADSTTRQTQKTFLRSSRLRIFLQHFDRYIFPSQQMMSHE